MMKFAVCALLVAAAAAHSFTHCDSSVDHLGLSALTLSPDPPAAGKVLTVNLAGHTDEAVTGGTAALKVSVYGITIATISFDVCKDMGIACPLAANSAFNGKITYTIPSAAPSGVTAQAQVTVTDVKGLKLSCINIGVTIGSGAATMALRGQETRAWTETLFEAWRLQHAVDFASADEYVAKMDVFAANHAAIDAHNREGHQWTQAHNEFSATSPAEFKAKYLGTKPPARTGVRAVFDVPSNVVLPTSVDWTTKGAVTPVKNQQQCGSCWAFSTTGSLEGAYFLKHGKLDSFSEQMLVDCDTTDSGCNGGLMDNAFAWIQSNGGLCTESAYPYTAETGTCSSSNCTKVPLSPSHTDVAQTDAALSAAIAQQPVSIAIEADQSGFQFYSSGVFTGACGTSLDHGVLAVGYGPASGSSPAYYKVKNSWGNTWGQAGYILIQKGNSQSGGLCGILTSASYPTL